MNGVCVTEIHKLLILTADDRLTAALHSMKDSHVPGQTMLRAEEGLGLTSLGGVSVA